MHLPTATMHIHRYQRATPVRISTNDFWVFHYLSLVTHRVLGGSDEQLPSMIIDPDALSAAHVLLVLKLLILSASSAVFREAQQNAKDYSFTTPLTIFN